MLYVFLISVAAVFYSYFGYLCLLWIVSGFVKECSCVDAGALPSVSLLISVYNEEGVIEEKVRNSLAIDYPKEMFEINVVSDGSTDNTDQIVKKYEQNGVILQHYEGRIGKTACLNQAVQKSCGDIVIFSDANSMYDQDAVRQLVCYFQNDDIGLVTGRTKYLMDTGNVTTESTGLYTRLEVMTKRFESKIGSCIGADGAMFAIRKSLYSPLASYDINDFVIPLTVIEKGYRAIVAEHAFCFEKTAKGSKGEFNRQVRITTRTIRAIFNHSHLLNPLHFSVIAFELVSHKLLKFFTPFFLVLIFFSSLFLMQKSILFMAFSLLQLLIYGSICLTQMAGIKVSNRMFRLLFSFVIVSAAYMVGWVKYFEGETFSTWEPERKQE